MRLLRSGLSRTDLQPHLRDLVTRLYQTVPSGVGSARTDLTLSPKDLAAVLERGAAWAVRRGFGEAADLTHCEEGGRLPGARPDLVSSRALDRGRSQVGTLGSGNHFVEVQYVSEVLDDEAAAAFGLERDQVTFMIHSGSRGLGHQVCEDHLRTMVAASRRHGITLPDRQLCCAPITSDEGQAYLGAMAAAANFAFANRQVMTHGVRESVGALIGGGPGQAGLSVVYDVCHNIAKFEDVQVDGVERRVCVHRKGATRAYPPGHPQVPEAYRGVGQPVLIPGDMGRYSYVLAGTLRAFAESFGSTCHGAGRRMSRHEAKRAARGRSLIAEMAAKGVVVMAAGLGTVAEEMPEAYKDVADVVGVVAGAGLSRVVARLTPIGVVKG